MTVSWAGYGLAKGDVDGRDSPAMTPGVLIQTESGLADPMTRSASFIPCSASIRHLTAQGGGGKHSSKIVPVVRPIKGAHPFRLGAITHGQLHRFRWHRSAAVYVCGSTGIFDSADATIAFGLPRSNQRVYAPPDRGAVRTLRRHRGDSDPVPSAAAAVGLCQSPLPHARDRGNCRGSGFGPFLSNRLAGHPKPHDGSGDSQPDAGLEHLCGRTGVYDREFRAHSIWDCCAQPPAPRQLVATASDCISTYI